MGVLPARSGRSTLGTPAGRCGPPGSGVASGWVSARNSFSFLAFRHIFTVLITCFFCLPFADEAVSTLLNDVAIAGINGGLGAHRYPLIGSGDTEASWATASYQMYMNIAGANLATAWTHGDGLFSFQMHMTHIGAHDAMMLVRLAICHSFMCVACPCVCVCFRSWWLLRGPAILVVPARRHGLQRQVPRGSVPVGLQHQLVQPRPLPRGVLSSNSLLKCVQVWSWMGAFDANRCVGCQQFPGNATTPGLCRHDPELHLRWLQQGALSSVRPPLKMTRTRPLCLTSYGSPPTGQVFRTHCEGCEIRPWMFPEGWPDLMSRCPHTAVHTAVLEGALTQLSWRVPSHSCPGATVCIWMQLRGG